MPALQVRDFPEELYEELRLCAKREQRSISQQTIVAVRQYLSLQESSGRPALERTASVDDLERRRKVIERIKSRPAFIVPEGFPSPEEIIREMRDSR